MREHHKSKWQTCLYISLAAALLSAACQDGNTGASHPGDSSVEFGFTINGSQSAALRSVVATKNLDLARAVLVTITDGNGNAVYDNERIELFRFNDDSVSRPISLAPGDYQLERFLVLDSEDSALYATPRENAPLAHLVSDPLPISFSVSEDVITTVRPEVLSTDQATPEDFGYASFGLNDGAIVETIDFAIAVSVYDEANGVLILTDGDLAVTTNTDDLVFQGNLEPITNHITVPDGYASYRLLVTKPGFEPDVQTLSAEELKARFASQDQGPISVVLLPAPIQPLPVELHAPGIDGEVRSIDLDGQELSYEVIDGLAIFQGDIVLGDADQVESSLQQGGFSTESAVCGPDFLFGCGRWPNGEINFTFANDWGDAETNSMMRARILQAIAHWESNTSIDFVRRAGDRVVFKNSGGCSSDIGKKEITGFDSQSIRVGTSCSLGAIIHEIGHTVGLWHEQSRLDRDSFVVVDFGRVQDFKLHNFFTHAGLGVDVGPYDYDSIMHYSKSAFARDRDACLAGDLGECTIRPLGGVSADRIGQRAGLSEGDILGAYTLYPPDFSITGATPFQSHSRFDFGVSFATEPVRSDYIQWTTNRLFGVIGTGNTLTMRSSDFPNGFHRITANIVIAGVTVQQRSIDIILSNTAPVIDLGGDRDVDLNRIFRVSATVDDAQDGICPIPACDYSWAPVPVTDRNVSADYRFTTPGPQTISVEVEDSGGATTIERITVNVVNTPPDPVILAPIDGTNYSLGGSGTAEVSLSGEATDKNEGPGPGPGLLDCSALRWSSSNPSDVFSDTTGCAPMVSFSAAGSRAITLTATDSLGAARSASIDVTVTACDGNCPPDVSFVIDTAEDFSDSGQPGYYLTTNIEMTAMVNDADSPPDNPLTYRWVAVPPCFSPVGCGDNEIVLETGTLTDPAGSSAATRAITWRPRDDVEPWTNCVTIPLPYVIRLEVTDSRGATQTADRVISLACQLI